MGILTKAINEQAFAKIGIFGNAGSGKTTTASYLAMGMIKSWKMGKPAAFFETEAGSDFLIKRFEEEGIELLRVKSHAIQDLIAAAIEAEKECSVLIVDSITHIWNDVLASKLRAVNEARAKKRLYALDRLEFQHYNDIKSVWEKWTTLFLNSKLNIIVCGRAGNIWEMETNEETGRKEIQKGGTKMKAEAEFGYEPSLLIEMERIQKGDKPGSGWRHRASILKDRTDTINGMAFEFEKPRKAYKQGDWAITFKPFMPAFSELNSEAEHKTFDQSRSSQELFAGPEGESRGADRAKQVTIALEEIQASMVALWPGQDASSKRSKAICLECIFGTRSWTAVENKPLEILQEAVKTFRRIEGSFSGEQFETAEQFNSFMNALHKIGTEITVPALELVPAKDLKQAI